MTGNITDTTISYTQNLQVIFQFKVHFCRLLFNVEDSLFADELSTASATGIAKCAVVIDEGLASAMPDLLEKIKAYGERYSGKLNLASPLVITGGEACKNDPVYLKQIISLLNEHSIDRHSYLLAIGGGALLDLAGLAAAVFHRGVRLVRAPTTVLAQNDAGVGVKNGINAFGTKNLIGSFAPPFAVFNAAEFLQTLSKRDRIAGISEAVKVALIRDPEFFSWLEGNAESLREFEEGPAAHMIRRCAKLHMDHISQNGDPFEVGSARPLDFGHWAAHRLEIMTSHQLRHGEAVSIGMVIDNRYAVLKGMLSEKDERRIQETLKKIGLPLSHRLLSSQEKTGELLQGLDDFREHLGGNLCITLLNSIGQGRQVNHIDKDVISLAIAQVGSLYSG